MSEMPYNDSNFSRILPEADQSPLHELKCCLVSCCNKEGSNNGFVAASSYRLFNWRFPLLSLRQMQEFYELNSIGRLRQGLVIGEFLPVIMKFLFSSRNATITVIA